MSFDPRVPPEDPLGTPPPLEPPFVPAEVTEGTGLPRNIAAALACIFLLVGGVAFYILDRKDSYVRFYALQSIVLSGVFFVLGLALKLSMAIIGVIPLVGRLFVAVFGLMSSIAGVAFLILWLLLIINAYRGKRFEMPVLWKIAKRHIPQALL